MTELPNDAVFPVSGALPPSLVWGVALAVAVETVGLHLWLGPRHPALAWTLVALGALSLVWVAVERRAVARRPVVVDGRTLALRAGFRLDARLDLAADVASVTRLDWRAVPAPSADYLNAASPGEPNVLVALQRPTPVRVMFGRRRTVTRIGIAVAEPDRLVAACASGLTSRGAAGGEPLERR